MSDYWNESLDEVLAAILYSSSDIKTKKTVVEGVNMNKKSTEKRRVKMFNKDNIKENFEANINNMNITDLDKNNDKIQVTREIIFYNGIDINHKDNYKITTSLNIDLSVILVDKENEYIGMFSLIKNNQNNEYFLLAKSEDFNFKNRTNKNYYLLVVSSNVWFKVEINLINKELEETKSLLCIDFGTSNTSVGTYLHGNYIKDINSSNPVVLNKNVLLNEINFVKFINKEKEINNYIEITPSVMYIEDCKDKNNIKYLFGYDAINKIKEENYSPKGKVLRSLKTWLKNINEIEEIYDSSGYIQKIERKTILKDYLEYIIDSAKQQFKCKFKNLHFTAPIKLKSQYIKYYSEILGNNYNIKTNDDSVDEGFASLYNTIKTKWDDWKIDTDYHALIIDSGGGTTDLASCKFKREENDLGYKMIIEASASDSDSNFGGDSITMRIMQYMKVVYSNYYSNGENSKNIINIDDFIPSKWDIFSIVDNPKKGVDYLYQKFTDEYKACEEIIPTDYKNYKNKSNKEYNMVLNNYYFLWELAEEMKKQFYIKTSIQRNKFMSDDINSEVEPDLNVISINKWSLSYYKNDELVKVKEKSFPNIAFTIREINKLIKGDIYNIVRKLLGKMYENKELSNFNIIKLSGQSCKIDLFKESLKEYIPGRALSFNSDEEQEVDTEKDYLELKLSCVRGAINYFKDCDSGEIDPVKIENNNIIPLTVSTIHKNNNIILVGKEHDENLMIRNIFKPVGTNNIELIFSDFTGKEIKRLQHDVDIDEYNEMLVNDLVKKYSVINEEEHINLLPDKASNFIAYIDMEKYGFYILNIKKYNNKIYEGQNIFYSFD